MRDRVADVLSQRAALESGAGTAIALSLLLHGGLTALAVYAALHARAPERVSTVQIQFASVRNAQPAAPVSKPRVAPPAPEVAKPVEPPKPIEKPKITEPTPVPPATTTAKPEKNTVPLSPFGRSTKKGSETPAPPAATAQPSAANTGVTTGVEVPVGGSGVTGLEGGDFPYTLYIEGMQRKIGTNWFRGQVAAGITTVVYFRINRDGSIVDVKVEKPSGNPTFDRSALSAVRSSSPLNPLPFAYSGTFLGVHLTFR